MATITTTTALADNKYDQKELQRTAEKLKQKYSKKRKLNEKKVLKQKTPAQKVWSVISTILVSLLIVVSCMLCLTCVIGRVQNVPPSFMGYNYMQIATGSMVASGFDVGDKIVVRAVDPDSLKPGDDIAFYVYRNNYREFYDRTITEITEYAPSTRYAFSPRMLLGLQTAEIQEAANPKLATQIVFHKIVTVYEDELGERWFKTRGTSNPVNDIWNVNEKMVVGIYDTGTGGQIIGGILNFITSTWGLLIVLLLPLVLLAIMLLKDLFNRARFAVLEYDIVEEKRKLTDEICVRCGVGYHMDTKTKYKVLVHASDEEKAEYCALLWKDGTTPDAVKKYCANKEIDMEYNRKLLAINRECEKMFNEGQSHTKIAKYYLTEKEKLQDTHKRETEKNKKMKKVNKTK